MIAAAEAGVHPRLSLTSHIPPLDGLRGIAILMVMFFHFKTLLDRQRPVQHILDSLSGFGWTGVDLFFVLSGFLITRILLHSRDADNFFTSFYTRRVLRIFPIYYVGLAVMFFAVPVILPQESFDMPHIQERLWYVAYIQNWIGFFFRPAWQGMLAHYWSLGVEEQFYLIWPLVIYWFAPKRVLQVILGACVFSIFLRFTLMGLHVDPEDIYRNTFTRMDTLLLGAACAFLVQNVSAVKYIHRHISWLWICPLATLAFFRMFFEPFRNITPVMQGFGYTIIALSYAGLLLGVVVGMGDGSMPQRILSSKILRGFGKYSYAAYIWHPLVRKLVGQSELKTLHVLLPPLVNLPLMIAATMIVSVFSYVLVERPFLALRRHFEPRLTPEPRLQPH